MWSKEVFENMSLIVYYNFAYHPYSILQLMKKERSERRKITEKQMGRTKNKSWVRDKDKDKKQKESQKLIKKVGMQDTG